MLLESLTPGLRLSFHPFALGRSDGFSVRIKGLRRDKELLRRGHSSQQLAEFFERRRRFGSHRLGL